MACQVVDPGNPYLWLLLTGCLLGCTAAQATIPQVLFISPRKWRTRKWTLVYILASLSIGTAVVGLFVAGWESFLSKNMIWYGVSSFMVAGLACRFKKAVGIGVVCLVIAYIVYFGFITYRFKCGGESARIAWYRVLEQREGGRFRVEAYDGEETRIIEVSGTELTPVITVLTINRGYILYGGKTLFLLNGLYKNEQSYLQDDSLSNFHADSGLLNRARIERFARRLPGIEYKLLSVPPFSPPIFQRYSVILDSDSEGAFLSVEPLL